MIKEQDILEAIAECQGERNPNANTCRNLAAFYTILDHIQEKDVDSRVEPVHGYSFAQGFTYQSESEFFNIIKGKSMDEILELFDEVMDTLQVVNPKLYSSIMRRVE